MPASRAWRPGRPRPGPGLPVELYTSAAIRGGRAGIGIVIRSAGQTLRVAGRAVHTDTHDEAAYRAILYGIGRARSVGARHIRVFTDAATVASELDGTADVPSEHIGLYLRTRAMLNAWRWSRVEFIRRDKNAQAALAAVDALDQEPLPSDLDGEVAEPLPLWQSAEEARRRR